MIYVVALSMVVAMVMVLAVLAVVATRDDPMGLGRTNNQAFTKGLDTIFGAHETSSRK